MINNAVMAAHDAIQGSQAVCYFTLEGRRYNFMSITEFNSALSFTTTEVPRVGTIMMGYKITAAAGSWSATCYYNQSTFRVLAERFQNTGRFPEFEIQVTVDDKTTTVGRQTIILTGCLLEGDLELAKIVSGEGVLEEELSGVFQGFMIPETFRTLPGM